MMRCYRLHCERLGGRRDWLSPPHSLLGAKRCCCCRAHVQLAVCLSLLACASEPWWNTANNGTCLRRLSHPRSNDPRSKNKCVGICGWCTPHAEKVKGVHVESSDLSLACSVCAGPVCSSAAVHVTRAHSVVRIIRLPHTRTHRQEDVTCAARALPGCGFDCLSLLRI